MKKEKTKIENFKFDDYKVPKYVCGRNGEFNDFFNALDLLYSSFKLSRMLDREKPKDNIYKLQHKCYYLLSEVGDELTKKKKLEVIQKSLGIVSEVEQRKPADVDCSAYSEDKKYHEWLIEYSFANYAHAMVLAFFNDPVKAVFHYLKGEKAHGYTMTSGFTDYMYGFFKNLPEYAKGEYFRTDIAGFTADNPIGEENGEIINIAAYDSALNNLDFSNGDVIAAVRSEVHTIGFLDRVGSFRSENPKFPRPVDAYDTFVITTDYKVKKARLFVYEYSSTPRLANIFINEGYRLTANPNHIRCFDKEDYYRKLFTF